LKELIKEKVWAIFVDIYAINDDGNLIDLAGLAALIALGSAKMPVYDEKEEKVNREAGLSKNDLPLDKDAMSFNLSVYKIGDSLVLDPNKEEEDSADYKISIAMNSSKDGDKVSSIQKSGEGAISGEDIGDILDLVSKKWTGMKSEVNKFVWGK